ncbi:hypothetical protein CR513_48203, partial [Mucuna pruriens]
MERKFGWFSSGSDSKQGRYSRQVWRSILIVGVSNNIPPITLFGRGFPAKSSHGTRKSPTPTPPPAMTQGHTRRFPIIRRRRNPIRRRRRRRRRRSHHEATEQPSTPDSLFHAMVVVISATVDGSTTRHSRRCLSLPFTLRLDPPKSTITEASRDSLEEVPREASATTSNRSGSGNLALER